MSRTEIKEKAREELMIEAQIAFTAIGDIRNGSYIEDETERAAVFAEMDNQFKRIEKLFGYVPGSWQRGI